MLEPNYIVTVLYVGLSLFAIHLIAALLMQERKYSVKKTALLWGFAGIELVLDIYFCFGLLSEPFRLPVALIIGFLFYAGIFIYASADGFWKKMLSVNYICMYMYYFMVIGYLFVLFLLAG